MWIRLEDNIGNKNEKITYLAVNTETGKSLLVDERHETHSILKLETPLGVNSEGVIIRHYAYIAIRPNEIDEQLFQIAEEILIALSEDKKCMRLPVKFEHN